MPTPQENSLFVEQASCLLLILVKKCDRSEILHHSQLAVGAGSPTALNGTNRLNKPALTHPQKSPLLIFSATSQINLNFSDHKLYY
jgi:hypothetical protein